LLKIYNIKFCSIFQAQVVLLDRTGPTSGVVVITGVLVDLVVVGRVEHPPFVTETSSSPISDR